MESHGRRLVHVIFYFFFQHKTRETDESEILAEVEYEFFNYRETSKSVKESNGVDLEHLTPGMFGYSLTRPTQNQDFYYGIFNACRSTKTPFSFRAQRGRINEDSITQVKSSTSLLKAGIPSPDPGFMKLLWNLTKSPAWQIGPAYLSMSIDNNDSQNT